MVGKLKSDSLAERAREMDGPKVIHCVAFFRFPPLRLESEILRVGKQTLESLFVLLLSLSETS